MSFFISNEKMYKSYRLFFVASFFILYVLQTPTRAQTSFTSTVDSLENLLAKAKNFAKVDLYNALSRQWADQDPKKAIHYSNQAFQLSEKLNYKKGTALSLHNSGLAYVYQENFDQSIDCYEKSLRFFRIIQDQNLQATLLKDLGAVYFKIADYPKSLDYSYQAYRMYEKVNDKKGQAFSLNNLGLIYKEQHNFGKAISNFENALTICRELDHKKCIAATLNNLGLSYFELKQWNKSKQAYEESLTFFQLINDPKEKAHLYNNLGEVHEALGDKGLAEKFFKQSIFIKDSLGNKEGIVSSYINLSRLYQHSNADSALYYARQSYTLAQSIKSLSRLRDASQQLSRLYAQQSDYKNALEFNEIYTRLKDSILNINNLNLMHRLSRKETDYNASKMKLFQSEALLSEKNNKLQLDRTWFFVYTLIVVLLLIFLVTLFLLFRSEKRKKTNQRLEEEINQRAEHLENVVGQLERANNELDTFLYKASHDLKGPLATLEGLSNLGMMETADETAKIYFQKQKQVIGNMQLLIFRIIEIGDIRNHKTRKEEIKMPRYLKRMIRSMNRVEGFGEIEFEMSVEEEAVIYQDAEMLDIVLDNIIKNAIQHAKFFSKDEKPKVKVVFRNTENQCVIEVIDNGHGVDSEIADKIFDMFFRGTDYFKGFGLGLYKSKIAIEKMLGDIKLTKSDRNETIFSVFLPFSQNNEAKN